MKAKIKGFALDLLFDIVGCFLFAVSVQSFSAPNNLAPGGVSGIAILINYIFGFPISLGNLALNLPLLILAWIFLGRRFTLRTIKTVAISTVMLELCVGLPTYQNDMILAALFCGVLQGVGLALVFMRGSTTGGSDVASRLIQIKFPHVSVGKILIGVDVAVLVASAIVYRNVDSALYAMVVIFACGIVIDNILYGQDMGKVMMIISDKREEIIHHITANMDRGCTVLEGKGGYTSEERPVLLCAVSRQEFTGLKRTVYSIDPVAFIVALDATEIIGEGFKDDVHSAG